MAVIFFMTKKFDGKKQIFSRKEPVEFVPLDEWENNEKIPLEMWVEVETCNFAYSVIDRLLPVNKQLSVLTTGELIN